MVTYYFCCVDDKREKMTGKNVHKQTWKRLSHQNLRSIRVEFFEVLNTNQVDILIFNRNPMQLRI